MKVVYLIRHGETIDNRNGIIQGQHDSPLTEKGRLSTKKKGIKLKDVAFDTIYCSPLGRAKISLDILLKKIKQKGEICFVKEIMELDFGKLSKKPIEQVKDIIIKHKLETDMPYPGGESGNMLKKRVIRFIDNYIIKNKGYCFLVVTHFGVFETLLSHYTSTQYSEVKANKDSIARLSFNGKVVKNRWIK